VVNRRYLVKVGARDDKRLVAKVRGALAAVLGLPDLVEVKPTGSAAQVVEFAAHAVGAPKRVRGMRAVSLLAVPFMGPAAKRACERAGLSWFDLSGNAHIVAPGSRIIIDGRPNQFRQRGRPATVFAPKSSRVARWLLMHPDEAHTQRELARATGLGEGFVSRIVRRLKANGYVDRDDSRALRVSKPEQLFDAWREQYDFSKHTVIKGHVTARSGDALVRAVSDALVAERIEHAATGLAAAWQLTHFAMFRIATVYVDQDPTEPLAHRIGFREDSRGANLWLVLPNDLGVFQGAEDHDGVRCVHPVQVHLDLQAHPERAAEAAERLRAEFLSW
jgi:hypothetical protein